MRSGIVLAYVLYRYFVFGHSGGRYGPVWVALIYLGQYLLGLALVSFWVEVLGGACAVGARLLDRHPDPGVLCAQPLGISSARNCVDRSDH